MGLKKRGLPQNVIFKKIYKIKKGNIPWNMGIGRKVITCPECGKKNNQLISQGTRFCNKKCSDKFKTNKNPKTYNAIHVWVRKEFGKPKHCEYCKSTDAKRYEWANITGKYLLKRSDWARLCCRCHRRFDLGVKNKIEVLNAYSISR